MAVVLPKKILLFRFSAMGDVVLLVPVLRSLHATYPNIEITLVTRPKFTSFFTGLKGVEVFAADIDTNYKGLFGLYRLFRDLKSKKSDYVIDLHDHLRTKILRTFFSWSGSKVITFKKGRSEKKKFTRRENKISQSLPHTVERYHEAFTRAGFEFSMLKSPHLFAEANAQTLVQQWFQENQLVKKEKWIGVAPFAMHRSKIWPVENYRTLFHLLLSKGNYRFFLFGGGKKEVDFFNTLIQEFPNNTTLIAGVLKLDKELAVMQHLDLMLCVDSSNMHLATLIGAPILSIWGGTHPAVGFGPYQRDEYSIVQISRDELPCRPCSVYGKETCYRGDFACLTRISPQHIADRVQQALTS